MTRVVVAVAALMLSTLSATAQPFDQQHAEWNCVLRRHVGNDAAVSSVDYAAIQADPSGLRGYVAQVTGVSPTQFEAWTDASQLAFPVNAYNALTATLTVDNYSATSIKDLGGWFSSPWMKRFFTLLGKERHLDDIEQGIIWKQFDEPRIHFAVNCVAIGCPPLGTEAYGASQLDAQPEDNTRVFMRNERRTCNRAGPEVVRAARLV